MSERELQYIAIAVVVGMIIYFWCTHRGVAGPKSIPTQFGGLQDGAVIPSQSGSSTGQGVGYTRKHVGFYG